MHTNDTFDMLATTQNLWFLVFPDFSSMSKNTQPSCLKYFEDKKMCLNIF